MDSLNSPLLATEEENQRRGTVRARDLPPISTFSQFAKESWVESKKLWTLAGPAILTILCQYAIGSVTQIFAGHLGSLQLAAVSIGITVIGGFTFGFMTNRLAKDDIKKSLFGKGCPQVERELPAGRFRRYFWRGVEVFR